MHPSLVRCLIAEVLGTFILVFLGCGAVHSAVLTDSLTGLWQVGIVWGIAIMLAAYAVGSISGAHINPAMSIALALFGRFSWGRVGPYVVAQLCGAFLAAAALNLIYHGMIVQFDLGTPTLYSAMCYGEYFPNPGLLKPWNDADAVRLVSPLQAFAAEAIGTALLALVVFATTDPRNHGAPAERFAPVFIGLCVTALICVLAPLTQACFNPARDFGPRLFAFLAGWRTLAIPGPNGLGMITVYIVAPIVGAVVGAGLYELVLKPSPNDRTEGERGTTS